MMRNDRLIFDVVRACCANRPLRSAVLRLKIEIVRANIAVLRANMTNGLDNIEDVRVNSQDDRLIMHVVQVSCADLPVRSAVLRPKTSIDADNITDVQHNSEDGRLSLPAPGAIDEHLWTSRDNATPASVAGSLQSRNHPSERSRQEQMAQLSAPVPPKAQGLMPKAHNSRHPAQGEHGEAAPAVKVSQQPHAGMRRFRLHARVQQPANYNRA